MNEEFMKFHRMKMREKDFAPATPAKPKQTNKEPFKPKAERNLELLFDF